MEETITVDARGLSCPQPALLVRKALQSTTKGRIRVLVDSGTARDNVTRLAQKMGWDVIINAGSGGGYIVELTK
jgi:tRNA 2-thiouridine synthesizing protein A